MIFKPVGIMLVFGNRSSWVRTYGNPGHEYLEILSPRQYLRFVNAGLYDPDWGIGEEIGFNENIGKE